MAKRKEKPIVSKPRETARSVRRVIWQEGQVTIAFFLLSENVYRARLSKLAAVSIGIPASK